VKLKFFNRYTA